MFLVILVLMLAMALIMSVIFPLNKIWLRVLIYVDLGIMIFGYLVYIIKVGGYSTKLNVFFFFSDAIFNYIYQFPVYISIISAVTNIARLLFPYLMLTNAIKTMYLGRISKNTKKTVLYFVLSIPTITLTIITQPNIYYDLFSNNFPLQTFVSYITITYIISYGIASIASIFHSYKNTNIKFIEEKLKYLFVTDITIFIVYVFFAYMDPIYMIQDYFSVKVGPFNYFFNSKLTLEMLTLVFISITISLAFNFFATWKYSKVDIDYERNEIKILKSVKDAKNITSGLMHGVKNQILSTKIIVDKLQDIENLQVKTQEDDIERKELTNLLSNETKNLLYKIDNVYKSLSQVTTNLSICSVEDIAIEIKEKMRKKYPGDLINLIYEKGVIVGDRKLLVESILNLIDNAVDAIKFKKDGKVDVSFKFMADSFLISVSDNGFGIDKKTKKKMFLPFYSSKNSSENWGVGLCYTREVTKKHLGHLSYETSQKGTTFFMNLPKIEDYDGRKNQNYRC